MHDDMKKIVELSDHPWIREKCPHEEIRIDARYDPGFLYFVPQHDYKFEPCYYFVKCRIHSIGTIISKEHFIWLPVGFNPETGNWQIDDLLKKAIEENTMNATNPIFMLDYFENWKAEHRKEVEEYPNPIILKLLWLRELIEKEK